MKIVKQNCHIKQFRDLYNGDVFEFTFDDHGCKMKIEETTNADGLANAVYLEDGELTYVGAPEEVVLVDCELVIK